jgi:uncharacterized protein YdcH (DUF465 family)
MTHAFDVREHAAASYELAGAPEGGALVPGLVDRIPQRPVPAGRGVRVFRGACLSGGSPDRARRISMFEGQPQAEVEALMVNPEFKQLYQRHKQLDRQVLDAELGVLAVDDATLSQMKREKLAAKDRLTRLFDQQH